MLSRLLMTATVALLAGTGPILAEGHASADTVVATVGDTEITLGHMIVLKNRLPQQYQSLPGEVLYEGILDQLVQQTLLGQELEELSVGSQKSLENEERALRASEVVRQIAIDVTTDDAVEEVYEAEYQSNPEFTEYNADHILFLVDLEPAEGQTEEEFEAKVAEQRARAEEVIADLEAGDDFAELAKERSEGPSASSGGALGWFESGRMVGPFDAAVKAMEPGTISSEPVRTQFGWHVIRLNETRGPSLEEVRPQIVEEIQRMAIDARVAELEAGAEVTRTSIDEIDPSLLDDLSVLGE